jgi:hypothetical protein
MINDPEAAFKRLQREVKNTRSEMAALNAVVRMLAVHGQTNAGVPEQHTTNYDRSTLRFYIWRDTPFGDDVVLSTGPSFESSVMMSRNIASTPGVGVYVRGLVADRRTPQLARTDRVAARALKTPGRAPRVRRSVVVEEAKEATATAVQAVATAERAADAVKKAVREKKPAAVVRKAVQKAEEAAAVAEEAAEVAVEAAAVAAETVPSGDADAELIKLANILKQQLGL